MRFWKRKVRVTVSGKGGSASFIGDQSPEPGLAITFSTTLNIGSKQNSGSVTITNLSASTRNKLGEEYDTLTLEVGYEDGGYSTIMKGDIRDVTHAKSSPDIDSTIEVGDGDKAVEKGTASKTFPTGTKPKDIVQYLQGQLPGVTKGEVKGLDNLPKTKRPVTVFGRASSNLDKLGREHQFYWSIQHGTSQVVKADEHLGGNILISAETGLVGVAEPTDKGVKFKALLNPALLPGKTVDVRSDFLDEGSGREKRSTDDGGGIHRIATVTFSGTTRSDDFYAEVEANRVQGEKVKK